MLAAAQCAVAPRRGGVTFPFWVFLVLRPVLRNCTTVVMTASSSLLPFANGVASVTIPANRVEFIAPPMGCTCPSPILDRTPFSLSFIMLLAVHNGGGCRHE